MAFFHGFVYLFIQYWLSFILSWWHLLTDVYHNYSWKVTLAINCFFFLFKNCNTFLPKQVNMLMKWHCLLWTQKETHTDLCQKIVAIEMKLRHSSWVSWLFTQMLSKHGRDDSCFLFSILMICLHALWNTLFILFQPFNFLAYRSK